MALWRLEKEKTAGVKYFPECPLTPPFPHHQIPADEVCGCPLVKDVFEPTGEFCRLPKRKCNKHYCWEKLRRAEVDLERVRVVRQHNLSRQ